MEPSIRIAEERNPSFCLSAGKPISSTVNPYLISSYLIALHYYYASYLSVVFKSVSTSPTNNYNNNCYPVATRFFLKLKSLDRLSHSLACLRTTTTIGTTASCLTGETQTTATFITTELPLFPGLRPPKKRNSSAHYFQAFFFFYGTEDACILDLASSDVIEDKLGQQLLC